MWQNIVQFVIPAQVGMTHKGTGFTPVRKEIRFARRLREPIAIRTKNW
jgi:hypothetical protein